MFDFLYLLMAAGGGFFAAAIGGVHAFIFTGFMVVAGIAIAAAGGGTDFLNLVAFGPVFGPHIAFAGAVAAAAYAARKTKDVGGKDIGVPLVSLDKPDVLLVGAAFGVFGYLVQLGVAAIPWFGSNTDSIAFTVIISAVVVRLAIGRSSLVGNLPDGAGWGRFAPRDDAAWIRWHERTSSNIILGAFMGLLAGGTTVKLAELFPDTASVAQTLFFGLSAMSLFFLSLGLSFPVTHHMTLIGGLAAIKFLPVVGGNLIVATLIGAVAGALSALLGEFGARLVHDHGNTHLDPPAFAIWPMTTVILAISGLAGAGAAS